MNYSCSCCASPSICTKTGCMKTQAQMASKLLRVATMKGKTSKTTSIPVPKPTMKGYN